MSKYFAAQINVCRYGKGHPLRILLLHDFIFAAAVWNQVIPFLTNHAEIIAPEFRGCGGSDIPIEESAVGTLVDDIESLLKNEKLRRVDIIAGIGLGGIVAVGLLSRLPRFRGILALIATPARLPLFAQDSWWRTFPARSFNNMPMICDEMLEQAFSTNFIATYPELLAYLRGELLRHHVHPLCGLITTLSAEKAAPDLLSKRKECRLVIINPTSDTICGDNLIVSPQADMYRLEGGHFLPLEKPEEVAKLLHETLDMQHTILKP